MRAQVDLKKMGTSLRGLAVLVAALSMLLASSPKPVLAGGTPATGSVTDQLITQQGSGVATQYGDYIGSRSGLNARYSYYIEVPSGLSQLAVDLFDADVGQGSNEQANERDRDLGGGGFNSCVRYSLYRPNGTVAADIYVGSRSNCPRGASRPWGTCATCDNAWRNLDTQANPQNGHWELRVDMSSSVTSGDDVNAFGIRAHDSGTELNVYTDSFYVLGINNNGRSRDYDLYPYLTSGCTADVNDFDWDASGGNPWGSLSVTSPSGAFSQSNATMSANDRWDNTPFTGWTDDSVADDYGIWTSGVSIEDYGSGNYGVVYLGNFAASNPPPTSQPQANTFRVYLPTDAGTAPVKPQVRQFLTPVSGPNPIQYGDTTRVRVTVEVRNPSGSMGSILFSTPSNVVTTYVPGGEVAYAGNASATGTIVSQPAVGGSGNVVWNPGTVASGATASLTYEVDVTPAAPGRRIPVTGTPGSQGTTARYVDETANATQSRATYTFGPLCELATSEGAATAITLTSLSARSEGAPGILPGVSSPVALVPVVGLLTLAGLFVCRGRRPKALPATVDDGRVVRLRQASSSCCPGGVRETIEK
jgi:hypothetical protein